MSALPRPGSTCARAREWASLRLDAELSQFEEALLTAHLGRCAACAGAVAETEALTHAIRETPYEPLRRPIVVPRRFAAVRAARVTAAAAVMLVAAGLGSVLAASVQAPGSEHAAPHPRAVAADDRLLRDMRRTQLRIERAMLQTNSSRTAIGHVI